MTDAPGPVRPTDELLDELLRLAVAAAEEAGALLTRGLARPRRVVATKSSSTDLVTEMDRASEALLVDRIRRHRPHDAVVGEEGTDRGGSSGVRWVLDPLDGTTNYLYGYPGWNVSISIVVDDRPRVGVVHVPAWGDTFAAVDGRGATCNGIPLRIGAPTALPEALVGTGFSYDPAVRHQQVVALGSFLHRIRDIRRGGAAAADLCAVAAGRLDGFYEHGLQPWDFTAGSLIAREAGARAETWDVARVGRITVAAHPATFDELVALVGSAGLPV